MNAKPVPHIVVHRVLWGELCDRGQKVVQFASLEDAMADVSCLDDSLIPEVANGQIYFWRSDTDGQQLASIRVSIELAES